METLSQPNRRHSVSDARISERVQNVQPVRIVEEPMPLNAIQHVETTSATPGRFTNLDAMGYPFDGLLWTKSSFTEEVTIDTYLGQKVGIIHISGLTSETVQIEYEFEGNAIGNLIVRDSTGTITDAATLGNGTYFIYMGD